MTLSTLCRSRQPAKHVLHAMWRQRAVPGVCAHTAGLTPKTQYFYQVGDEVYALSGIYNFTSLANTFPVTVRHSFLIPPPYVACLLPS